MSDETRDERLKALSARIEKAKADKVVKHHSEEHYSQANVAWRMVIELVSGLGLGFAIGYGLDILLGTMPIFLVVFIGLGFAAGVKVMMRTAAELQRTHDAGKPAEERD
ncbi:AtpZ/AtpI family protein [Anianabacter salinae]|uniref:AtpZ/AtpI family protein n=1 Tax=Anianabacter salinae TaxID=2851023 RepID=UPI00225E00DE|nr:AtpZ/AtpI family protein [Anianabacter salinae]MBV0913106.1 AtpZ/AtpI family protein [Anianabacter salinae]